MTFLDQAALFAAILLTAGVYLAKVTRHQAVIRRDALLEGAAVLRRRAATKWEKNPNAAIEANACAAVLEQMAGVVPVHAVELREQAA
jgi:hypothetical protein